MTHALPQSHRPASGRLTALHAALGALGLLAYTLAPAQDVANLPAITVNADNDAVKLADKVSSGALGQRSELDTPFSTRSISSEALEARQATSLAEALKYDASVTTNSPSISTHPATISMRGLRLDDLNGYKIDGLATINRGSELPLEMFESVELLKGLSGFMYGFGSPGGIVNYVTKRPTDDAVRSVDLGYTSGGATKAHLDIGNRFGQDDRFGFRLNAVREEGGLALESGHIDRSGLGLSMDARLAPGWVLRFDTLYQQRNTVGGTDIITSASYAVPTALSGRTRLHSTNAYNDVDYALHTLSLDHPLAGDWKGTLSYRDSSSERTYRKDQYYITSNSGNYRDRVTSELHKYAFQQLQEQVQGHATWLGLRHDIVLGAMVQDLTSTSSVTTPKTYIGTGNLYAPTFYDASSVNYSGGTYDDEVTRQSALFASDTVQFSDQWSALAGWRYTRYRDTAYTTKGGLSARYDAHALTPTLSLMYKPVPQATVYVSHVQALEQADSAPSTAANAKATFAPIKSQQQELGIKAAQGDWSGSAAVFRITRGAQYTNSANVFVSDGETRYQGLELNGGWQATQRLSLNASVMWLDAKLTQAAAGYVGKRAVGAARQQAAAEARYQLAAVPGLALRAGVQYTGKMALDAANVHQLNGTTLVDAGLHYQTRLSGYPLTLALNVTNLANRKYWTFYQENYLNVGAPRTATFNAKVDF